MYLFATSSLLIVEQLLFGLKDKRKEREKTLRVRARDVRKAEEITAT